MYTPRKQQCMFCSVVFRCCPCMCVSENDISKVVIAPSQVVKVFAEKCRLFRCMVFIKHLHASLHQVTEALQLAADCNGTVDVASSPPRTTRSTTRTVHSTAEVLYYVNPQTGNDDNSGLSPGSAWRTLPRVLKELAKTPPSVRPPTTVNLLPGTHMLTSTLTLSAIHSGNSPANPVVFRATGTCSVRWRWCWLHVRTPCGAALCLLHTIELHKSLNLIFALAMEHFTSEVIS